MEETSHQHHYVHFPCCWSKTAALWQTVRAYRSDVIHRKTEIVPLSIHELDPKCYICIETLCQGQAIPIVQIILVIRLGSKMYRTTMGKMTAGPSSIRRFRAKPLEFSRHGRFHCLRAHRRIHGTYTSQAYKSI